MISAIVSAVLSAALFACQDVDADGFISHRDIERAYCERWEDVSIQRRASWGLYDDCPGDLVADMFAHMAVTKRLHGLEI